MINKNNTNRRKTTRIKKNDRKKEESDDNEELEEEKEDSINEDDEEGENEEEEEKENEEEEEEEEEEKENEEEDKEDNSNEEEEEEEEEEESEEETDNNNNSNEEEEEEEDKEEMKSNEDEEEESEKEEEKKDKIDEEEELEVEGKDTNSKEELFKEIEKNDKPIINMAKENQKPPSNKVLHKTKSSKPKSIKSQQLAYTHKPKEIIKFDYMSSKSKKKIIPKLLDKSSNQSKQKTKKSLITKIDNPLNKKNLLQNANIIVPEIQSKKRRKPNFLANPFISSVTSSTESHQSPLSTASFAHVTNDKTSNQQISLNNKEKDNITKKGSLPNKHIKKDNMTLTQSEKGSKFKTSNSVRHYININIDSKFKKSKGSTKSKSSHKTKSSKGSKKQQVINSPITINWLYKYFEENNILSKRAHSIRAITHKTLRGLKGRNRSYSHHGIVFQSNKLSQPEKYLNSKKENSSIRSVKTNQTKKKSNLSKNTNKPKRTNTNKMNRNEIKNSKPNEETELNPFFKKLKHTIIKHNKSKKESKVKENYKKTIVKKKVEIPITNTVIEKENDKLLAIEGNSFLYKVDTLNIPKKITESNKKISTPNNNNKIISSQEKVYMLKKKLNYEEEPPIDKITKREKETMYEESNNNVVNSKKVFDGKIAIMTYDEKIHMLKQSNPNSNQPLQIKYDSSVIDKSNTHLKIGDNAILKNIKIENISNIKDNQIKNIKEEPPTQIKPNQPKKLNNAELINENQTIELTKEHVKITNDGLHMHVIESNSVQDSFNILGDKYHIAKNITSDINTIQK